MGITGTNGKTSTTRLIAGALEQTGAPVAQTSTVGSFVGGERVHVPSDYRGFLQTMRAGLDAGGRFAAIELTSEALARGFTRAWPCHVGVFTNCTRDHLDAHGSAEHYLASKAQLFMQLPPGGCAVLNAADPSAALLEEVTPAGVRVLRYAVPSRGPADAASVDLVATAIETSWAGTQVEFAASEQAGGGTGLLRVRAIGDVYAENALAALLAAIALGVDRNSAIARISDVQTPPGRFEVLGSGPRVVVDYAHTPDALRRTIAAAKAVCPGHVVLVFGAGGDRDRAKRPLMGEAARAADAIVLTSDNPRSEDPSAIAEQIRAGMGAHARLHVELDRAHAIAEAIHGASQDDVVLIAGKGHETTQTRDGAEARLSDRELAEAALGCRG